MDITEVSILHHAGIVLLVLWLLSLFNRCHPIAYLLSFIYMYLVHERYVMRLRRKLQYEERKQANQRRVLTDSETVRWLNRAVEKMWPICMEQIASQKILLPIIPWFLEKYKPWTAKKAVVQHLYLGRNPPVFTEIRVLQSTGDDHLVLELGMNFLTADDMSTILAVQLRKRLGFGIWAKLHLTGMHVEGKVLVGVRFLREWPFLGRLRICFSEPPYFQMTVKPVFTHGLDVTELPGIAGWLDKLLSIAFEQTLVEPNMLVVDLEKFISPNADDSWFSVDEKEPVAYAKVEVIEASDMKPSDLNGLADPYVKGQVGPYRFKTKIQKKTLAPKWHEEFKIPICTWESTNVLAIEVCDKDHFVDDTLGDCSVNISDLRDGQRHELWLSLQNIKMGRLHLAITVIEDRANTILENDAKGGIARPYDKEKLNKEDANNSFSSDTAHKASFSSISADKAPRVPDNFEPINVEGQNETGIWVHQPGSEVAQTWEPRKGKSRRGDTHVRRLPNDPLSGSNASASGSIDNDSSSGDENGESKNLVRSLQRGFRKMSAVLHRSPRNEDCSGSLGEPVDSRHANLKAVSEKEIGVNFIVDETLLGPASGKTLKEGSTSVDGSCPESPSKGHVKDMAKSILKHAGKGARSIRHVLSRKGSTKIGSDTSIVTVEDIYAESDSSDDESLSSPQVESIPVVSNTISCCCENNGSCDHKEHTIQRDAGEPATKEDDIHLENLESQEYREKLSDSDRNGNGLIESSSLNLPEENPEVEKG